MATNIIDPVWAGTTCVLTSELACVTASTDEEKIAVELSWVSGGAEGDVCFFSTTLYSFDAVVELVDAGALIEEFFRLKNLVTANVKFRFGDVVVSVPVLYCEVCPSGTFSPEGSFLLASDSQQVHQDSIVAIAAVPDAPLGNLVIKAAGHVVDGDALAVVRKEMPPAFNPEGSQYFPVADIIMWALSAKTEEEALSIRDVVYFGIEYNGRHKMCFIVPEPAYLTFSFRNIFNVREYVDVAGVMTSKTVVNRELAQSRGTSLHYNRAINRSYEMQTRPLAYNEIAVFEQLISSHEVYVCVDGQEMKVLVTDHTCEPDSDNATLSSVRFTWRFADRRPHLFDTSFNGIIPIRRRVFDDHYTVEYE